MAQQRRRPVADSPQPFPGFDEPVQRDPLARVPSPQQRRPASHHRGEGRAQGGAQGRPHKRDRQEMASAPTSPHVGEELQLDPATIVLSLPVAISIGQMIIDGSLDAMPQTVFWAGVVAVWKAATAPGVGRGSLDWIVDSINLGPQLRDRLGVPERLPRVAPRPRAAGAWGFVDGLSADVRNLRAAIRARRGEVVTDAIPDVANGHTERAAYALHSVAALDVDDLDVAAVEALDDAAEDDVPDIGLPVVHLEAIVDLDNLWVVGPKNSGKTSLLRLILEMRKRGRNWALDPHATPGKWPNCETVGGGLEFGDIDLQLHKFMGWMRQRYKAQSTGDITEKQCKAARRTMVGDEWRAIRKALPAIRATRDTAALPSAADRLLDILSQGRKAGICALVASHADTAESMGVSGEKDILKCFDLIVYLGAIASERVPAAAKMRRPAVVYDPERNAWAQLIIPELYTKEQEERDELPVDEDSDDDLDPAAPARRQVHAADRARPLVVSMPVPPPVSPATVSTPPDDDLFSQLLGAAPTTRGQGDRAARLAAILARQAEERAAYTPAPATAPLVPPAPAAVPVVAPVASSMAAPKTDNVVRSSPTPAEQLVGTLVPAAAQAPVATSAATSAATPGLPVEITEFAEGGVIKTTRVVVGEGPGAPTFYLSANASAAPAPTPAPEPAPAATAQPTRKVSRAKQQGRRRDSALMEERRQARIAYYQHAAQQGISFYQAYKSAPRGNRGNSNEMLEVYQAAKPAEAS